MLALKFKQICIYHESAIPYYSLHSLPLQPADSSIACALCEISCTSTLFLLSLANQVTPSLSTCLFGMSISTICTSIIGLNRYGKYLHRCKVSSSSTQS